MMMMMMSETMTHYAQFQGGCDLVGTKGLIIQGTMALVAFSSLLIKRQFDQNPKHIKIWFMDTSKQVLQTMLVHLANVVYSIILNAKMKALQAKASASPNAQHPDECDYYLVTFLLDSTLGTYVILSSLVHVEKHFRVLRLDFLLQGNYHRESVVKRIERVIDDDQQQMQIPVEALKFIEIFYISWFLQTAIWLSLTLIVKLVIYLIEYQCIEYLADACYFLLAWMNAYPIVKLLFVMCIIPMLFNTAILIIQDRFLSKKDFSKDQEEVLEGTEDQNNQWADYSEKNMEEFASLDLQNEDPKGDKSEDFKHLQELRRQQENLNQISENKQGFELPQMNIKHRPSEFAVTEKIQLAAAEQSPQPQQIPLAAAAVEAAAGPGAQSPTDTAQQVQVKQGKARIGSLLTSVNGGGGGGGGSGNTLFQGGTENTLRQSHYFKFAAYESEQNVAQKRKRNQNSVIMGQILNISGEPVPNNQF